MLRNRLAVLLSLVGLALTPVYAGCASSTNGPPGTENPDPNGDEYRLEFVNTSGGTRVLPAGQEFEFQVRYYNATTGAAQAEATIDFGLEGSNLAGSTLNAASARTDANGFAKIRLRTGNPTQFVLVATPDIGNEARVNVTVTTQAFGDLRFVTSYSGARSVPRVEVGLFGNWSCEQLFAGNVVDPNATRATIIFQQETMTNVAVGPVLSLYAVGIDVRNNVAAEGCIDITDFAGNDTTPRTLTLTDVSMRRNGTYDVVEQYDITEGFPAGVEFAFDAISGLLTDPAAYIIDIIATWNTNPVLNPGGGTPIPAAIEAILAIPSFRTALETPLRNLFNQVTAISPGWLRDVGYGLGDLAGAFQNMNLRGTLNVPPTSGEVPTVNGMHVITSIVVTRTTAASGAVPFTTPAYSATTVPLTVGDTLLIGEHTINFNFGNLLKSIVENQILSRFSPDGMTGQSVTQVVSNLVACSSRFDFLRDDDGGFLSGFGADIGTALCDIAVNLVGGMAENLLYSSIINWDRMTLEGSVPMVDQDGDYDAEKLLNGTMDARWWSSTGAVGAAGVTESIFTGTINGTLNPDPSATSHPVRARLNLIQ